VLLVKSENTLPFFFWSSKMLYTNFYTSSKRKQPVKVKKATSAGYIYEKSIKERLFYDTAE